MKRKQQHIGVYGVISASNQILLVKKTRGPYSGKWDLPGGTIEHGEGILEALQRELVEEVNVLVSVEDLRFWGNLSTLVELPELSFFHIGMIYEVLAFDPTSINLHTAFEDVAEAGWLTLSSLSQEALTPFAAAIAQELNTR